jgi:hypothetical protein
MVAPDAIGEEWQHRDGGWLATRGQTSGHSGDESAEEAAFRRHLFSYQKSTAGRWTGRIPVL